MNFILKRKYDASIMRYNGLFFFVYFAIGSITPFIGQYLNSIGYSGVQIGQITSLGSFAALIFQPIWGIVSDKTNNPKRIIMSCSIIAALCCVLIPNINNYYILASTFFIFMIFNCSISPLSDFMALSLNKNFGKIRSYGSYGFGVAVLVLGIIVERYGFSYIFFMYIISTILVFITVKNIYYSNVEREQSKLSREEKFKIILKNKRVLLLFLASFFVIGTIVSNNTYFGLYYVYLGGSASGVGVVFLLACFSEVPIMGVINKAIDRFGIENLMILGAITGMMRWMFYSTSPNYILIIITFFLHGIFIGFYMVSASEFINRNVKTEVKSTVLGLYASISTGLSGMVFNYIGGVIIDYYNPSYVYMFFAFACFMGAIVIYIIKCMTIKQNKRTINQ